jgi:hypothetical protein
MTLALNFERDSPPGSEDIVENRLTENDRFNRYQRNAPFKNSVRDERITSFVSSKSELDAELKSTSDSGQPKSNSERVMDESEIDKDEIRIVQHLIDLPNNIPEQGFETTETVTSGGRRKTRKKKGKRGKSLEREIAQLILKESLLSIKQDLDSAVDGFDINGNVSTNDILSDLTSSCQSKKTQECSDFGENSSILEWHTEKGQLEILSQEGETETPSNASNSYVFQFSKEDEWTAFDDSPKFNFRLLPPHHVLDKNGFPTSREVENIDGSKGITNQEDMELRDNNSREIEGMDSILDDDVNTVKTIENEEVDQVTVEAYTQQQGPVPFNVKRKTLVYHQSSVDDVKNMQIDQSSSDLPPQEDEASDSSESATPSVDLFVSSTGHSHRFESPNSPSSVTEFGHKQCYKQCNTLDYKNSVSIPNAHLSGAFPTSPVKPTWKPKPPEHYNYSSCEI